MSRYGRGGRVTAREVGGGPKKRQVVHFVSYIMHARPVSIAFRSRRSPTMLASDQSHVDTAIQYVGEVALLCCAFESRTTLELRSTFVFLIPSAARFSSSGLTLFPYPDDSTASIKQMLLRQALAPLPQISFSDCLPKRLMVLFLTVGFWDSKPFARWC